MDASQAIRECIRKYQEELEETKRAMQKAIDDTPPRDIGYSADDFGF